MTDHLNKSVRINTITNGSLYRNQFTIGVDDSFDFGPTSATSFWNGITPSTWTIYQNKASRGPSIITAGNDGTALTVLQSIGATGSTLANALAWVSWQSPNTLAVNQNLPNIITSGLTFYIDSGYAPSYPQQGNNWFDISGKGNNLSSTTAVVYNGANGGILKLPTVTPGLTGTATNVSASTYTYGAFVGIGSATACNSSTSVGNIFGLRQGTTQTGGISIWVSGNTAATCRIGFNHIDFTGLTNYANSWKYFVGTQNSTTETFYVDGVQVATSAATITTGYADKIFLNTSTVTQGGNTNATVTPLTGYTFHIYNRALSSAEVLANYNALKTRVGL